MCVSKTHLSLNSHVTCSFQAFCHGRPVYWADQHSKYALSSPDWDLASPRSSGGTDTACNKEAEELWPADAHTALLERCWYLVAWVSVCSETFLPLAERCWHLLNEATRRRSSPFVVQTRQLLTLTISVNMSGIELGGWRDLA